jgi:2,5-dioxopentanoate dehydrogenase
LGLSGKSMIGCGHAQTSGRVFFAIDPATGDELQPGYHSATNEELNHAVQFATDAFPSFSRASGKTKGALLRKIAEQIEALGDDLVTRAVQETALAPARIKSETARTCFQLRLFAELVEDGSWIGARIDRGDPERNPVPKPDVRSLWRPIGPVAVFCASNFPIAFSVAGGDTASALAAGNPVVVKAHPAHPGTAELVGRAVCHAVQESGAPEGVFSLLFDSGVQLGLDLVKNPGIRAVGFTGSRTGGRALMDAAAARSEPIPVFAEMSSANPLFILPGAMKERKDSIAKDLYASVTLGAGQFCTKPGVVIFAGDSHAQGFTAQLGELMNSGSAFTLLTERIRNSYQSGVSRRAQETNIAASEATSSKASRAGLQVSATLFVSEAATFLSKPDLQDEIFGPSTLLVNYSAREELLKIANQLEGHLTASVHGTAEDLREYADLIAILESKVGRLIFNGYPTGVEVCHAMVHGGPYPATSDGRTTSVGTQAIYRFARPVCYQNFPNVSLPDELKDENPLRIWRLVDGKMTQEALKPRVRSKSG